uniref:Uncharacterized protein n=1 Tax=Rhodopseudomonas palustris (strain DX-1) TaxID=652103 RepID=E6VFK4_RHOPX
MPKDGSVDYGRLEALPDKNCEALADKSEGQRVLERILAVHRHMNIVERQIESVKRAIGLPLAGGTGEGGAGREVRQFLPALDLLADQMEEQLGRIEGHVNDLARAF